MFVGDWSIRSDSAWRKKNTVTYPAVVATRYSEVCVKKEHRWCVGTFARGGRDGLPRVFTRCSRFKADPPRPN